MDEQRFVIDYDDASNPTIMPYDDAWNTPFTETYTWTQAKKELDAICAHYIEHWQAVRKELRTLRRDEYLQYLDDVDREINEK
jgi:hypothetical protein